MTDTTLEGFLQHGAEHSVTPVVRRLFADSETPMGLYRKLSGGAGSFLLESADQSGKWSRYSFIGVSAHGVLSEAHDTAVWLDMGMSEKEAFGGAMPSATLDALDVLNSRWNSGHPDGLPPFLGGLVGYIGWDAVRELEKLPRSARDRPPRSPALPGAHARSGNC